MTSHHHLLNNIITTKSPRLVEGLERHSATLPTMLPTQAEGLGGRGGGRGTLHACQHRYMMGTGTGAFFPKHHLRGLLGLSGCGGNLEWRYASGTLIAIVLTCYHPRSNEAGSVEPAINRVSRNGGRLQCR